MLGSLGWQELVLILAILGLLFGGSRVADLGGSLGRGIREFRLGLRDDEEIPALPSDVESGDATQDSTPEE
jgi:sec-independent protein translocase protein TatA